MDGGHGGIEEERREERAVQVVCCVETGHGPVAPRKLADAKLAWDREHAVEHSKEAGAFHGGPSPFSGKIEFRVDGRFTLWIVVGEPLGGRKLCPLSAPRGPYPASSRHLDPNTNGKNCQPQAISSQFSREGGNQFSIRGILS